MSVPHQPIRSPHPSAKLSPSLAFDTNAPPSSSKKPSLQPCIEAVTPACHSSNTLNFCSSSLHLRCSARWLLVLYFQHVVECVLKTKQLDSFIYVGSSRELSTQPGTCQRFNDSNKKVDLATKLCQRKTKVPWAPLSQTLAVPGRFSSQCLIVSHARIDRGASGTH